MTVTNRSPPETHLQGPHQQVGPTWQVALGNARPVRQIVIWNQLDGLSDRLSNFRVSLLRNGVEVFGQSFSAPPSSNPLTLNLPAVTLGDTVQVRLLGQNAEGNYYLSLAEVQVLG
jgi:hypothetical protein